MERGDHVWVYGSEGVPSQPGKVLSKLTVEGRDALEVSLQDGTRDIVDPLFVTPLRYNNPCGAADLDKYNKRKKNPPKNFKMGDRVIISSKPYYGTIGTIRGGKKWGKQFRYQVETDYGKQLYVVPSSLDGVRKKNPLALAKVETGENVPVFSFRPEATIASKGWKTTKTNILAELLGVTVVYKKSKDFIKVGNVNLKTNMTGYFAIIGSDYVFIARRLGEAEKTLQSVFDKMSQSSLVPANFNWQSAWGTKSLPPPVAKKAKKKSELPVLYEAPSPKKKAGRPPKKKQEPAVIEATPKKKAGRPPKPKQEPAVIEGVFEVAPKAKAKATPKAKAKTPPKAKAKTPPKTAKMSDQDVAAMLAAAAQAAVASAPRLGGEGG